MSKRRRYNEDGYESGEGIIISGADEYGFGKDPLPGVLKPADTKEIGLAALSALSVLGISSVIAPGAVAGDPSRLNAGNLWGSLGLGLATAGGIYYGFERPMPALAAAGASALVFLLGMARMNAIKSAVQAAPPPPAVERPLPPPGAVEQTAGLGFDPEVGV